jgi:hypothetical protein
MLRRTAHRSGIRKNHNLKRAEVAAATPRKERDEQKFINEFNR